MKKTNNVNLNSQVFCIDEDACTQLQIYIETLEKYYLSEEDGKEIMADIESRIAELFKEFLQKSQKEVISQTDIDKVIEIMGTPDVIIDEDSEHTPRKKTGSRKLYRNRDKAILGGVAAGLAAYLSISAGWVRLAFLVFSLCYGLTLVAYLILWIVLPEAATARQKLEMNGENINVSTIEKNIRNTYSQVVHHSKFRNFLKCTGDRLAAFFSVLGEIIRKIMSLILNLLAGAGFIAGIFFLFFSACTIIFSYHFITENYAIFSEYAAAPVALWVIKLVLFLMVCLPLFLITYYSASRLFGFRGRKSILFICSGIWMMSCFTGLYLGVYYTSNFAQEYKDKAEIPLIPQGSTPQLIHVKFNSLCHTEYRQTTGCGLDNYILYSSRQQKTDSTMLYFKPSISFETTELRKPELIITRSARGFTGMEAAGNTEDIRFISEWKNDTLSLDNYFRFEGIKWRANFVRVKILIPENYQLNLINAPGTDLVNRSVFQNIEEIRNNPSITQSYEMKNGQLIPVATLNRPSSSVHANRPLR